jgi:hypothetical protein
MNYRIVPMSVLLLVLGGMGTAHARQRPETPPLPATGRVVLTSGTIVEVLGTTENPGPISAWWAPDGRPLKRAPATLSARLPVVRPRGVRDLAVAVRLTPPGTLKLVTATFEGGKRLAPQAFAITDLRRKDGTWLISFSAPDGAKTATFQLGIPLTSGQVEMAELRAIALRPAP